MNNSIRWKRICALFVSPLLGILSFVLIALALSIAQVNLLRTDSIQPDPSRGVLAFSFFAFIVPIAYIVALPLLLLTVTVLERFKKTTLRHFLITGLAIGLISGIGISIIIDASFVIALIAVFTIAASTILCLTGYWFLNNRGECEESGM